MARIAGINIPLNKRVEVGLTYIYGIGQSQSRLALQKAGVDPDTYVKDLTEDEVRKLREVIDNELSVEGDLRRERSQNVKRLQEIGAYRRLRRPQGHGAGPREGRGLREGSGLRPRDRHPLAAGRRARGHVHPRRHAAGPQRLPSSQAEEGLARGARQGSPVQAVPPGGREALPEGRALTDRPVRRGAALLPAGRARARPGQAVRVQASAEGEAEGAPLLRRA